MASQSDQKIEFDKEGPYRQARGRVLSAYSRFDSSIEAIRDLALNAKTHTQPLDDGQAYFLKLVRRWNVHEPDESIVAFYQDILEHRKNTLDAFRIRLERGERIEIGVMQALRIDRREAVEAHTQDPANRFRYSLDIDKVLDRRRRNSVLHSSLLVSAVASFEVLVGEVARSYMTAFPETMTSSELSISTEQLRQFTTLDDFWDAHRDSRVEKLMRDDVQSWMNWFQKYLKVNPEQLCPSHTQLIEIFQTRNIHIHNAGKVNEIYLRSAQKAKFEPRRRDLGRELPISQKYLLQSIDLLHVTSQVATFAALRKFDAKLPEDEGFADGWLHGAVYSLLEEGLNQAVLDLSTLAEGISGDRSEVVKVNAWVALKETNGLAAIAEQVESWDTSSLEPRFQLVKLALLDDYVGARAIADQILGTNQLSVADWNSWPVLRGLRQWVSEDPDRGRFLQAAQPGKD